MFIQDKRAHLNEHIEASVDDHLELTWSSLVVAKQELDNMKDLRQKFHEIQEVNQKLTGSVADSREEVRDLTLTVKSLEIQNIQLKKWMEDKARKMASGILTESMAETRIEVLQLKRAIKNLELQNTRQKTTIEAMRRKTAFEMKSLEIQMAQVKSTHACAKAQFRSLESSTYSPSETLVNPESLTSFRVLAPREESKKQEPLLLEEEFCLY